jgi:DNA-binding response OmpR family regulator
MAKQTKCALIVEDDQDIRRLIEILLRDHCANIDTASDGEEAIAMLRRSRYDLVVLDIMLPKVNGFDVAEMIRTLPAPPKLIVLSAVAESFRHRFPEDAIVLQKPFELGKLGEAVALTLAQ